MTPNPLPPPRLGPRPLPLHMAVEGWILQMSLAGLLPSSSASSLSKPNPLALLAANLPASLRAALQDLMAEAGLSPASPEPGSAAPLNPASYIDAISREATQRMETFARGVRAYQAHPYRRDLALPPAAWRMGAASLRDYGGPKNAPPVLFVPSLINRAYILDLAQDRSLLRAAAKSGLRAYLLDWGDPGDAERRFTSGDYIEGVLIPALEEIKTRSGQVPRLVGYCLGGTLSVAPAVLRPDLVSALGLLAAPWDFHSGTEASRVLMDMSRPMIEVMLGAEGVASVDMLQALFASLDPTLVGRKFRGFASLDPASDHARRFVELEDWLNDGVPLSGALAAEVFFTWYGSNDPLQGQWKIGDRVIDPGLIGCPTLAFIPTQDRIVPPGSAHILADRIPTATAHKVDLGHIGMVAAANAPLAVYAPLLDWLQNPASKVRA